MKAELNINTKRLTLKDETNVIGETICNNLSNFDFQIAGVDYNLSYDGMSFKFQSLNPIKEEIDLIISGFYFKPDMKKEEIDLTILPFEAYIDEKKCAEDFKGYSIKKFKYGSSMEEPMFIL